jgi:peroxiredoxin
MSEDPTPGEPGGGAADGAWRHGLDPDLAAEAARRAGEHVRVPAPVIDTRPYRWMIGTFGLVIVIVISVVTFLDRGVATTGVPANHRLLYFAAPLARSDLNGVANIANPTCSLAKHDPRALNVCLIVKRGPLVLAFFVTGATECKREVDTMQALSRRFPTVQFAAVAVDSSHSNARKLASSHGWTIPVAYDSDGAVGDQYGVQICPLVELAYRGGIVQDRLIGDDWVRPAALAQRVRALLATEPR